MTRLESPQVVVGGLTFPEAPRWHAGRLWFSDFFTHRVLALDASGSLETIVEVPQQPSGFGWTPAGDLLIVSMLDRRLVKLAQGALLTVTDLSPWATGPCNDMVVDSQGRAYVGNFGFDRTKGEPERLTCLVRIDPDGSARPVAEGLLFPNGAVITPDGRTLIAAETFGHRLTAFNVEADGSLSGRRMFADLPGCFPDGICLDSEGAIWVADARGKKVIRVFEGGRIERTVSTGQQSVYACMLGGVDRKMLYLCTSSGSGPEQAARRDGKIEAIRVEVPGAGLP